MFQECLHNFKHYNCKDRKFHYKVSVFFILIFFCWVIMSVPPVEGFALVRVNMSMSRNAKIALAAVVITGLACLVIAGIAVAGVNGMGPMGRFCGAIVAVVSVNIFVLTIMLASVMKTLTLSKEQKSFKKLQKLFYERRSECKKKANQLKRRIKVNGAFIGVSRSVPNPHGLSSETVEVLEQCMSMLPSMHSRLLQLIKDNAFLQRQELIDSYKECMEVATLVREFAIMSAIGVEKGVVDLFELSDMRNPELNSLGVLVYYPEALAACFEREFDCLDIDSTRRKTNNFTEFKVLDVLGNNANNVSRSDCEIDEIKETEIRKLERLLLLIDETSKTADKFDSSYLMHLAKGRMPLKSPQEYTRVMNFVLSSLLYHDVCSRACLDEMPDNVILDW